LLLVTAMNTDTTEVKKRYGRIGGRWSYNLLSLAAFQGWEAVVRRRVVSRLHVRPGAAVLDLACGRGANFPYLQWAIGDQGRIVGVDYSDAMLDGARELVRKKGWHNVALIEQDAAQLDRRNEFDAAIATLAMAVIPDWRKALERMVSAVHPGGRIALLDGRLGTGWRAVWNPYYHLLARIAAADLTRDIPSACRELLIDVHEEGVFFSNSYIVSGTVGRDST
jgi:demethylmenaquinone methyltransferase/2-methoxy-6-polyprenyl-1,4-benzoquinol methylase